jgi:hypothetical protein
MTLLKAYYDASGSQSDESEPLAVAGVATTTAQWDALLADWKKVLRDYRVPHMHMADFNASSRAFSQGWKGDERKRIAFLGRLAEALESRVQQAYVIDIRPADFRAVDREYRITTTDFWVTPYMFAATICVEAIEAWFNGSKGTNVAHSIVHIFEKGDGGQGPLAELVRKRGVPVTIVPKHGRKAELAFQAVDCIANEYRALARRDDKMIKTLPPFLAALSSAIPIRSLTMSRDALSAFCRDHPTSFPARNGE